MTGHPTSNNNQTDPNKSIRILQINLNKSEKAHLEIINEKVSHKYDIMLIQEPYTTSFNAIRMPANFRPVYPENRTQDDAQIRSVIWVNKSLDSKDWTILNIPDTSDISAIQLKGPYENWPYLTSTTTAGTPITKTRSGDTSGEILTHYLDR